LPPPNNSQTTTLKEFKGNTVTLVLISRLDRILISTVDDKSEYHG